MSLWYHFASLEIFSKITLTKAFPQYWGRSANWYDWVARLFKRIQSRTILWTSWGSEAFWRDTCKYKGGGVRWQESSNAKADQQDKRCMQRVRKGPFLLILQQTERTLIAIRAWRFNMTNKQICFLFFVNIKREMNICCSPAVEDPGKECDKDGGGEVE